MKQLTSALGVLCLALSALPVAAQIGGGVSGYYSASNAWGFNGFLSKKAARFGLGYVSQQGGQLGTVVDERKPNYGLTEIGRGSYFTLWDIGFGWVFKKRATLYGELGFGTRTHYTNYSDKRFRDDGYSLIRGKDPLTTAGVSVGWIFKSAFEPYIGVYTTKKFCIGARWVFGLDNY